MKCEEIIYYNELTQLTEPFTQKNIADNGEVHLGAGMDCHPAEILDLLFERYECFAKTSNPEVSLFFELKHTTNYLVIDLGVQLKEWARVDRNITMRGATLTFQPGDIAVKGVKGKALAKISNVNLNSGNVAYLTAVYQTVGNIALAMAKYLFYDENWQKYIRVEE